MQIISASEYRRQLVRMLTPLAVFPVQLLGTLASGSKTVTASTLFVGFGIGWEISGPGIAVGTTVVAIDSVAGTLTLSIAATASASLSLLTLTPPSGLTLHLFSAPPSPGPEPTPASFTEATFDFYAPVLLSTYVGPWTDDVSQAEVDAEQVSWVLSANPTVPNNIFGYWIDYPGPGSTSGPGFVMLWENFLTQRAMVAAGNAIVLVAPLTMPLPTTIDVIP